MENEFGVDEDYEAMVAGINGKPIVNKGGINEDYEAMRADMECGLEEL